jgi:putative hydrolases of HD superfamily
MEVKAENPVKLLLGDPGQPFLVGFFELCHLKQLYRQGWLRRGIPNQRCESVAEHSFAVAVLALWLGQANYPQLDLNRVLPMALLHDIGEVYAGDIIPSDQVSEADKHRLERASLEKVLGKLPASQEFLELWLEFERGESPEARFVHQIDRLEMGLQARVYQAQGFAGMEEFILSARHALVDQQLVEILEE